MCRSVAQKIGLRQGSRAFFANAPDKILEAIGLPALDITQELDGDYDYIHHFSTTRAEMDHTFPTLKSHLRATGMLWLSWPKGRRLGSDLVLPTVIEIGYRHGLVESTCLRIDHTWAGLKFTHPKKDKIYNNSYGTLPDR